MKFKVGFSRAQDWYKVGSKAIEIAEKRPYSHAFVRYIDPFTQRDMVAQASHGMVNQLSFIRFIETNTVVKEYEFDITPEQFRTLLSSIEDNLGTPYGKLELLWIAVKKLFHVQVNIHDHDDSFICSEFVARILQILNILSPENVDFLTPSDLDALLQRVNK